MSFKVYARAIIDFVVLLLSVLVTLNGPFLATTQTGPYMPANDPQIGPQQIRAPEMFASPVIKEWNRLENLSNGFKHLFLYYNATIITFKRFASKYFITLTMQ